MQGKVYGRNRPNVNFLLDIVHKPIANRIYGVHLSWRIPMKLYVTKSRVSNRANFKCAMLLIKCLDNHFRYITIIVVYTEMLQN